MAKAIDFSSDVRLQSRVNEVARLMRGATAETIKRGVDVIVQAARGHAATDSGRLKASIRGRVRKARGKDELLGSISSNTRGKFFRGPDGQILNAEEYGKLKLGRKRKQADQYKRIDFAYGLMQERGKLGENRRNYTFTPYLQPAAKEKAGEVITILRNETTKAARSQKP